MAERACRDGSTSSRRQSFRRSLAEAGLPDDALDRLEAKRKQLDDSIHKYIAAKEREYKSFEKDEIQRHKLGQGSSGSNPRRTSSESTQDTIASPQLRGQQQQQDVVDALLSAGLRREHIGQPHSVAAVVGEDGEAPTLEARPSLAGLTDRRASIERDKEFIGVFTPTFLPALENGSQRADSAPPGVGMNGQADAAELQRANSDPVVQAKQKRPIQLQLASRTSSSGSSADGSTHSRLTSALKSPTHPRPKTKRVSLAVGNTIVAPSDNVPITLGSNNSTPSHSRTRSPASDRESSPKHADNNKTTPSPKDSPQEDPSTSSTARFPPLDSVPATMTSPLPRSNTNGKGKQPAAVPPPNTFDAISSKKPAPAVDGDLDFALDEDDMIPNGSGSSRSYPDSDEEISGRVRRNNDDVEPFEPRESEDSDSHAEHMEDISFHPGSVQQTNSPGFRRPSVSADPVYKGRDYAMAEHNAATNEIYGSTSRPQASFTGGSLGESFMATNAARMMRDRKASEQTQVRS